MGEVAVAGAVREPAGEGCDLCEPVVSCPAGRASP
ncbi:hypothetical protein P405_22040 [Streptomyces sp. FR-008]|nr:hypothetical protein SFR_6684 [Streptomyces sp. FR-008]KAF0791297.1 hypothetical protein P405_22040 [Streptomyces sp. FR-008]